jgi:hypothetical protein
MSISPVKSRWVGLVAGATLLGAGALALASPSYAATAPAGTYVGTLVPYLSNVTGHVTLTHDLSGWSATAQLAGLTKGDVYEYDVSIAGNYVEGQAHSFTLKHLCSFRATSTRGSCGVSGAQLDGGGLTPQSAATVYSPQAHTSVASAQFGYLADLSGYDGMSQGGAATIAPNPDGTWSGRVSVSGLTPGASYSWGLDIADAWNNGQAVGWNRTVVCQFRANANGEGGCHVASDTIAGLADVPYGSFTDVASSVTAVATGDLY